MITKEKIADGMRKRFIRSRKGRVINKEDDINSAEYFKAKHRTDERFKMFIDYFVKD